MVPLKGIKKTHARVVKGGIYQLVNLCNGKRIFRISLIQISEIHTNPALTCFLLYHHGIGQQLRIKDLFNSPDLLKLTHFFLDYLQMCVRGFLKVLILRIYCWIHIQVMANEIRVNSWCFI